MSLFPSRKQQTLAAPAVTYHVTLISSAWSLKEPSPTLPGSLHPQQKCITTIRKHYDTPIFYTGITHLMPTSHEANTV